MRADWKASWGEVSRPGWWKTQGTGTSSAGNTRGKFKPDSGPDLPLLTIRGIAWSVARRQTSICPNTPQVCSVSTIILLLPIDLEPPWLEIINIRHAWHLWPQAQFNLFFSLFLFCLDSYLTMLIVLHIYISTEVTFNHASICEF